MFIELVDALRCLNEHEESWLVAAVERFEGRYIDSGSLGCPVCRAEYRIARGAVDFRSGGLEAVVPDDSTTSHVAVRYGDVADELLRVRALLNLQEHGGTVVFTGMSAVLAAALETETEVNALLINAGSAVEQRAGRSTLLVSDRVPLARASIRGAVAGEDQAGNAMLAGLASALRVGGRLVAPASSGVPPGLQELARDERQWVALKSEATSGLVTLGPRR